jgi:hypothetical protein
MLVFINRKPPTSQLIVTTVSAAWATMIKKFIILSLLVLVLASAQDESPVEALSHCPKFLSLGVCIKLCKSDDDCLGIQKCCEDNCGGAVCRLPSLL